MIAPKMQATATLSVAIESPNPTTLSPHKLRDRNRTVPVVTFVADSRLRVGETPGSAKSWEPHPPFDESPGQLRAEPQKESPGCMAGHPYSRDQRGPTQRTWNAR